MTRFALLMFTLLVAVLPLRAQGDPDSPTTADLPYDTLVEDSITDNAPFDRWVISADEGDIVVIEMVALGGLAPLVAVLDENSNLLFTSDFLPDGTYVPPQVDGVAELEFQAPWQGNYILVATREGRDQGTTTGTYTLLVRRDRAETGIARENTRQQVVFRCGVDDVTTAATVQWTGETNIGYRVSVYGLDGFAPVARLEIITDTVDANCTEPVDAVVGDVVTLPGGESFTVAAPEEAARIGVAGDTASAFFVLTVGSRGGEPGRYVALIEGFSIAGGGDEDLVEFRVGPLATSTGIDLYMLGPGRLDPQMIALPDANDPEGQPVICDDAGRRGCESMPPADGVGVVFAGEAPYQFTGDRFDAAVRLQPGHPNPVAVQFVSRGGITTGPYALFFTGELPPRDPSPEATPEPAP